MESKEFNFLMYSILIGNWNHALNIIERLKKEVDSNQLPILTDIQKAIIARKDEDYETAKKLWKQIQIEGKNLSDAIADFAKVAYYDTIADSNKKMEKKCYLKIEEYCRKKGDPILILIYESSISKNPDETAILFKKTAEELTKAGDIEDAHYANGIAYFSLTKATKKPEKKAELHKKAAEELTKAGDTKQAHRATSMSYLSLVEATKKPEEKAELFKKAAEEFTKAADKKQADTVTAYYYMWLAEAPEKSEEKAELYEKAAAEFTKIGDTEQAHYATAQYYTSIALANEKPEKIAELFKKAAEEFTNAGATKEAHYATAWYYAWQALVTEIPETELYIKAAAEFTKAGDKKQADTVTAWYHFWLAETTEKPEDNVDLYKKAAEEFTKIGDIEQAHYATGQYYTSMAEATEEPEEKAELYKKAAEELKEGGFKEDAHKLMAKQYFFLSLSTKRKSESERYQLLASGETKLGWLYLTQIAFNEFKKSKTINTYFLELTIELYKKYLKYKNRQFPVSNVYLCGDITGSTEQIMVDFKFNLTSFPRGKFKNTPKFKEEVKRNDFVLMELNKDIDDELLYELGLVAGMEKPIIVLISEKIKSFNKFIPKIATVISNRKHAFTALKLFSVIKSGGSLSIVDKTEKSAVDDLMRGFKEKPLFISRFELDKTRLIGRYKV